MKVYAISDLHSEFYATAEELYKKLVLPDADLLILAGDIGCPTESNNMSDLVDYTKIYVDLLTYFKSKYKHVVLVPGNHEYYHTKDYYRDFELRTLENICKQTEVHLLNRDSVVIDDIEFIGCTLWSAIDSQACNGLNDFTNVFRNRLEYLQAFMEDYLWLKLKLSHDKKIKTLQSTIQFQEDRKDDTYLENDKIELAKLQSEPNIPKKVVITHHLPSARLIHKRFQGSSMNTAFYTNIVDEVEMHNVKLWVAGHTHEFAESRYGNTQLFVNPIGYPGEERVTKVSSKVFEI